MPSTELPLAGVRVIDLSRLLPGSFCSQMLADFGADVIKVEDQERGDESRWMGPRYESEEPSVAGARFLAWNRGKRAIQLDLKSQAGRDAFLRLSDTADIVLESFRPGVMERLGLSAEAIRERNGRLIYCALSGYGQTGPYAHRSGHDLNYLAATGVLDLSGELDGPPVQPAVQIADIGGGSLMALAGILTALYERQRSGQGQVVDVAMFDGAMAWASSLASRCFCSGHVHERGTLDLRGGMVSYMPYPCKDGWVTIAAIEPKFWEAFCRGIGRDDLIPHREDRSDGWAQGELEREFRRRTRAEWDAFAAEHDCCLQAVLSLAEALESELGRAMVIEIDQPGIGPVKAIDMPIRLSRTPADVRRRPSPALGEHTEEVLNEIGLRPERVTRTPAASPDANAAARARQAAAD